MMGLLSLAAVAILFFGGFFVVKNVGIGLKAKKDSNQDKMLVELVDRVNELEKNNGIMMDVMLEIESVDKDELAKKFLRANFVK